MSYVVILLIVVAIILVVMAVGIYNSLVRQRNECKNSWSQIDVQLKRRHDLVPNLVETAKGYMKHERELLEGIAKARSNAVAAHTPKEAGAAEGILGNLLTRFMAVVENYPELKANQNMLALQEELTSTENKISFARQHYNDAVMHYNNRLEVVPSNIVAGMFGFEPMEFFEVETLEEREVVKVQF
ncbi:MAG: LemA family protein [Planctomycetes bacterium]|nr:LemA family protein [Planctomycetota bacterium]